VPISPYLYPRHHPCASVLVLLSLRPSPCCSASGLKRMSRKHMHFAAGELGEASVKSGLRTSAQIYVYLDVPAALAEGLVLYRSAVSRAPESRLGAEGRCQQPVGDCWCKDVGCGAGFDAASKSVGVHLSGNAVLASFTSPGGAVYGVGLAGNGTPRKRLRSLLSVACADGLSIACSRACHFHYACSLFVAPSFDLSTPTFQYGLTLLPLQLYFSQNNVLLTSGFGPEGVIPTHLFLRAVDSRTGEVLWPLSEAAGTGAGAGSGSSTSSGAVDGASSAAATASTSVAVEGAAAAPSAT
jgi:hypothetical protein